MFRFRLLVKIVIIIIFFVAGGYALSHFNFAQQLPAEFTQARLQGALISQNIVNLSNQLLENLNKVSNLEKEANYLEALNLTTQTLKQSQEIRNEAVKLAQELEKMTVALSGIRSAQAKQVALESISNRLALINRLINYSDYLSQLLEILRNRFFLGTSSENRQIDDLIAKINDEVKAINNFNAEAAAAMEKFDKLIK